jgi:UDP-glucose 4-epimerase
MATSRTSRCVEDAVPDPRSPYAVSKLAAEYYVRTIGGLWSIETVALRVFNAYGPGQPIPAAHPPVVAHFLRQAVRGGTLVIHSRGDQTRDFVYLDDVVEAMVAAATVPTIDRRDQRRQRRGHNDLPWRSRCWKSSAPRPSGSTKNPRMPAPI